LSSLMLLWKSSWQTETAALIGCWCAGHF